MRIEYGNGTEIYTSNVRKPLSWRGECAHVNKNSSKSERTKKTFKRGKNHCFRIYSRAN